MATLASKEFRQGGKGAIFIGNDGGGNGPLDADLRIVPDNADFVLRMVEIGALVLDLGLLADHAEAVQKAWRYVELAKTFGRQDGAHPASKGLRTLPDVDGDIEDLALYRTDEFALWVVSLGVKTAQSALPRGGVIVLDEGRGEPGRGIPVLM